MKVGRGSRRFVRADVTFSRWNGRNIPGRSENIYQDKETWMGAPSSGTTGNSMCSVEESKRNPGTLPKTLKVSGGDVYMSWKVTNTGLGDHCTLNTTDTSVTQRARTLSSKPLVPTLCQALPLSLGIIQSHAALPSTCHYWALEMQLVWLRCTVCIKYTQVYIISQY